MLVPLSSPLTVAGRAIATIELRPPGRKLFDVMQLERGPVRFSDTSIIRFAARLSGHGEGTIRRLGDPDLETVGRAVETLYVEARRRFISRRTIHKGEPK